MHLYHLSYNDASVCYLCIGLAYQKIKEGFCKVKGELGQRELRDLQYMNNFRNKLYNFKEGFNGHFMSFIPLELEDEELIYLCHFLKYTPIDTYNVLNDDENYDAKISPRITINKFLHLWNYPVPESEVRIIKPKPVKK